MGRQHDEDKIEQKKSEVRMNRWYNRLLNRHQDDPVSRLWMSDGCTHRHVHHTYLWHEKDLTTTISSIVVVHLPSTSASMRMRMSPLQL